MDKNVITTKTQRNAENACGNRMWQLGFKCKCSGTQHLVQKDAIQFDQQNCAQLYTYFDPQMIVEINTIVFGCYILFAGLFDCLNAYFTLKLPSQLAIGSQLEC